jgi:hypothetical protein
LSTATNPIGVFPFHPICESAVRESRRRRRCCAGPREDVATPTRRRRARGGARRVAHRTGRRRGGEPGAGARTGAAEYARRREHLHHRGHLHRRECLHRPEHRRHATDRPATTTPSPHREHCGPSTLFPSLVSFLCWIRDVETRRRYSLPECWPSRRRTAVPRRRELLSRLCSWAPPSPCDENVWGPAIVPGFLLQGRMGESPPRFEPRPWLPGCCAERARRGRACPCTVAATHRRARGWDAGIAWVQGGARGGS